MGNAIRKLLRGPERIYAFYVTYPHNFIAFHTGDLHIVLEDIPVLLWGKNRVGDDTQGTGYSFEEIGGDK